MERILLLLDELEDAALVAGALGERPAWRRRGLAILACVLAAAAVIAL